MLTTAAFVLISNRIGSLVRFGGIGLILIGLADNSAIPLPGGMDLLTILLAAGHRRSWAYYALMATIGSIIGGYVTYRLGKKGGKEALEKKLPKKRVQRAYKRFEAWGFWSVFMATLIPPPFPIAAAWLTAGALRYSVAKFLVALALGRAIRYSIVAYLGNLYGVWVLSLVSKYYKPALVVLIAISIIGGAFALVRYRQLRRERKGQETLSQAGAETRAE